MSKDPAVLFYTSDFLTGTTFFTYTQKGQYITLLCQQHQLGEIPEGHMTNICGSLDSPVVQKFVRTPKGSYYNERMRAEAERRTNYCESRRSNMEGINQYTKQTGHVTKHTSARMETDTVNENENKKITKNNKFIKPSITDISLYCKERKNNINPQTFFDSNEAKGWVVGTTRTPMKDWKAVIRTWEAMRKEDIKSQPVNRRGCEEYQIPKDWK